MDVRVRLRRLPLVGIVLLVSGFLKGWGAVHRGEKARDSQVGGDESHPVSRPVRLLGRRAELALTFVELAIAAADIALGRRRLAGVGGTGLFGSGLAWFAAAKIRRQRISCQCFGVLSRGEVGPSAYVRNGLLLALAVNQASVYAESHSSGRFRSQRVVRIVIGVVICAETLLIGYLMILLASVRRSKPAAQVLRLIQQGELVPRFEVLGRQDKPVDLVQHYAQHGHTRFLVLVGAGDCKGCHSLWKAVARHAERISDEQADFAFIWLGGVPGEPEQTDHGPKPRILVGGAALRSGWEFADLYGAAQGAFGLARVPAAFMLDGEGRLLERPSLGQDAALTRWKQWSTEQTSVTVPALVLDGEAATAL